MLIFGQFHARFALKSFELQVFLLSEDTNTTRFVFKRMTNVSVLHIIPTTDIWHFFAKYLFISKNEVR
jgi:hypothetical protein